MGVPLWAVCVFNLWGGYDYQWPMTIGVMWRLSVLPTYYVPKDGPLSSYKEYISMLPTMDHPEAFGQHPNADITSQIQETRMMFEVLLSLQPQTASGVGESREDKVSHTVIREGIPVSSRTRTARDNHTYLPSIRQIADRLRCSNLCTSNQRHYLEISSNPSKRSTPNSNRLP